MKVKKITVSKVDSYSYVRRWIMLLEGNWLTLRDPINGLIIAYSADGDRIELDEGVSIDQVFEAYAGIQAWLDDSHDLFLSWLPQQDAVEFFVDGLSENQIMSVADSLCCAIVSIMEESEREAHMRFEFA